MKQFLANTATFNNVSMEHVDNIKLQAMQKQLDQTAVADVFVYDTSLDSDGGAWRNRTQHTSWYNEELNTATRGARREFPAVAVIVAEASKVTIYDGDDPDLGMWMVINQIGAWSNIFFSCLYCLNGKLVIGSGSGYTDVCFIKERMSKIHPAAEYTGDYIWNELIYNPSYIIERSGLGIVHNAINDVAMTVLPNAPIDDATGLPVPTIAVATDGGVSVIKHDGTVVNSFYTVNFESIAFSQSTIYSTRGTSAEVWRFDDYSTDGFSGNAYDSKSSRVIEIAPLAGQGVDSLYSDENLEVASANGLSRIHENSNLSKGMLAYTTSKYNTGWMCGDIKLAALSDSVVENVGVNSDNLLTGDNSTFDGGVGDWSPTDLTSHGNDLFPVTNSNSLKIDVDTGQVGWSSNTVSTVVGQAYMIALDYAFGIGCTKITVVDSTATVINRDFFPAGGDGATSIHFIAESTQTEIRLVTYSGEAFFDNISVRATTELITNGDFSNGTTGWVVQNNSNINVENNQLAVNATGNYGGVEVDSQYLPELIPGKTYIMAVDIDSINGGAVRFGVVSGFSSGDFTTPGVYTHTFVFLEGMNLSMIFVDNSAQGTNNYVINSVSVRPAEADRSVNDNGLQIFGEINKTPVASGADLVAYSGFSANNYLVQPYNADLDFGTGDFSVMGWYYSDYIMHLHSATDAQRHVSVASPDNQFAIYSGNSGRIDFTIGGVIVNGVVSDVLIDGLWQLVAVVRKNNVLKVYVDDKVVYEDPNSSQDVSNIGGDLYLGGYWYQNVYTTTIGSKSALLRISKTAPTAEQIAKIYREEKTLFQQDTQATLYGTSDAVTALAHDPMTDLLHVGTSDGQSVFNGLRRVKHDDEPITKCIHVVDQLTVKH